MTTKEAREKRKGNAEAGATGVKTANTEVGKTINPQNIKASATEDMVYRMEICC